MVGQGNRQYTAKQGQYLTFIYYYKKLNSVAPAEVDFQRYFKISPSAVHQMILTLERLGFIARTPGQVRPVKLAMARTELPDLE